MGLEYVNRRGDRYYLLQGKTKTGKPKYYVARKPNGVAVEQMPVGFEFYENPQGGLVSVRKLRPTNVLPQERERLEVWTRELAGAEYFLVDVQDDSFVVYTPGNDPSEQAALLSRLFGGAAADDAATRSWIGKRATYLPMLRFTLVDPDERLFDVERWCYLGSIDDWFPLASGASLEKQARKYLPHLNKESFYNLM